MIVYKPADRISIDEVVALLRLLRDSMGDEVGSVANELLLAAKYRPMWLRVDSVWELQTRLTEEHPHNCICYCGVSDGIVAIGGFDGLAMSSVCHHFSVITRSWRRLPRHAHS